MHILFHIKISKTWKSGQDFFFEGPFLKVAFRDWIPCSRSFLIRNMVRERREKKKKKVTPTCYNKSRYVLPCTEFL